MTASLYPRSSRVAVKAAVLSIALQAASPTTALECTIEGDADERIFRVVDRGSSQETRWWLTLQSRSLGNRVVELPLPNAKIQTSVDQATVTSISNNGGLAVEISVRPDRPIFDVFVNFELEVNVWRDLSPDVDLMNTNGPHAGARCRVQSPQRVF